MAMKNHHLRTIPGKLAFAGSALAAAISSVPTVAIAQDGPQLEEVVVTAQRREQSMQDVPVAVTAVTGDELAAAQVDSIVNIQQLSSSTRFAVVNSAANSANIVIRGIGTVGNRSEERRVRERV